MILDERAHLAVRSPESLTDADGIVYDLDHRGIIVIALAVVEDGIYSHLEIAHLSVCHHCHYGHLCVAVTSHAVAVNQVHPAMSGHCGLLAHIADSYAEVAASLVDVERSGLENGGSVISAVEVAESHIVSQELIEIPMEYEELAEFLYGFHFLAQGKVLRNEGFEFCLAVFADYGLHPVIAQNFHFASVLGRDMGCIGIQFGRASLPLVFGDGLGLRKFLVQHQGLELAECRLPGRVDAVEVQFSFRVDSGNRVGCNLCCTCRQVLLTYSAYLRGCDIEYGSAVRVELRKGASHKEVSHLGLEGIAGIKGSCGVCSIGIKVLCVSFFPGVQSRCGCIEGIQFCAVYAVFAAPVLHAADSGHTFFNQFSQAFIIGRFRDDDPVSVEFRACKYGLPVGNIPESELFHTCLGTMFRLVFQQLKGATVQQ